MNLTWQAVINMPQLNKSNGEVSRGKNLTPVRFSEPTGQAWQAVIDMPQWNVCYIPRDKK